MRIGQERNIHIADTTGTIMKLGPNRYRATVAHDNDDGTRTTRSTDYDVHGAVARYDATTCTVLLMTLAGKGFDAGCYDG